MGWREFLGWLGVMKRQLEPPVDHNSFDGPEWDRMRAERDAMRG